MGLFSWLFGKPKQQPEQKPVVCDSENFNAAYTPPKAPPQAVSIEDIARDQAAQAVKQTSISSTDLDQGTLGKVLEAAAASASKGESPIHSKVKSLLPDDFEWKEYDQWLVRFEQEGVWPWEAACDLWAFTDEAELYELDELLKQLSKDELLTAAEHAGIHVHKSKTKAVIAAELAVGGGVDAKAKAIELITKKLQAAAIREKKELFASWVQVNNYEKNKVKRWGDKYVELAVAPDACPLCQAFKGKKLHADNLPELHPGCRCTFMPIVD